MSSPAASLPAPESPRPRQASAALSERLRTLDEPASADPLEQESLRRKRWRRRGFTLAVVAAPLLVGAAFWFSRTVFGDPYHDLELKFQPVERGKVTFTIVEKGDLEAVRNTDVTCYVRNRRDGLATTIKWLIQDGTQVKKGDIVVRLDDASLRQQKRAQFNAIEEMQALLVEAEGAKEIVDEQNKIAIKTAKDTWDISQLNYEKYVQADRVLRQLDLDGRIKLAKADKEQWEARVAWSERMVDPGFISISQFEAEKTRRDSSFISSDKLDKEIIVRQYEDKATELELRLKRDQAEVAWNVAKIEAKGKAAKAEANLRAKIKILEQEQIKLKEIEEDIDYCTLHAPNDGMVVYNTRPGAAQHDILAVGDSVYESKVMLRIPDLRKMQVRIKIHESLQGRVRADLLRKVHYGSCYEVAQALVAPGGGWLGAIAAAPAARQLAIDGGLLPEAVIVKDGLPAQIKVASVEGVLTGQVKWISTVASQIDSVSADVRVHPTLITVHATDKDLRPGMSAEVTIFVEERDDVLRIPVHALLETGSQKFCYVKVGRDIQKRIVETGLNNNRFVEICKGIDEGEFVVQNPRPLAEQRGESGPQITKPRETARAVPIKK